MLHDIIEPFNYRYNAAITCKSYILGKSLLSHTLSSLYYPIHILVRYANTPPRQSNLLLHTLYILHDATCTIGLIPQMENAIDIASKALVRLVGEWKPECLTLPKSHYMNEAQIPKYIERARNLLNTRETIPLASRRDIMTFETSAIADIIDMYSVPTDGLSKEDEAAAMLGRVELNNDVMAEYLLCAYDLYLEDQPGATTPEECKELLRTAIPVCF